MPASLRSRGRFVLVLAAPFLLGPLGAAEPGTEADSALIAALEAEIAALRALSSVRTGSATVSYGVRHNVLLSSMAPIDRTFTAAEIEGIFSRPQGGQWKWVTFLNGDVVRYLPAPRESAGEQQWKFHTEARWESVAGFRAGLRAVGYWHDTVIDFSEFESVRLVAPARLRGGQLAFAPGIALPLGFRLEATVQGRRNDYRDHAGDHDEFKGAIQAEWQYRQILVIALTWLELQRNYDERINYTAGGRPLPGTQLRFRQRDGELWARLKRDGGGKWSLAGAAGWLENRDRFFGYFDYTQQRASLDLSWQRTRWTAAIGAEGRRTEFETQTVGAGLAPPRRRSDEVEGILRLERAFNPRWSAFAEHSWERSRSNEPNRSYRTSTIQVGIGRNF